MDITLARFAGALPAPSNLEKQARGGVDLGWRLVDAAFRMWIPIGLDEMGLHHEAATLRALRPISVSTTRAELRAADAPRTGEVRSAVVRAFFALDKMMAAENHLARGGFDDALSMTKEVADHAAMCAIRVGPKALSDAHDLVDYVIGNVGKERR